MAGERTAPTQSRDKPKRGDSRLPTAPPFRRRRWRVPLDGLICGSQSANVTRRSAEGPPHASGLVSAGVPSATGAGTVLAVYFDRLAAESRLTALDDEFWEALP